MINYTTSMDASKEDDPVLLPGFRFHPTDEELVSFYLRRKIEKKLMITTFELIKQIDIYKYDPWDLARNSHAVTDREWYFFCKRGRKYRNSVRPNRVTGSGFWKATGIDKPIYSVEGHGRCDCIGLKKSLVYYRGSAGKGTKTDWMMHEFRLPADQKNTTPPINAKAAALEAEIWTLCRIFKRNMSHRRYAPDCMRREVPAKCKPTDLENWKGYVSFGAPVSLHKGKKPDVSQTDHGGNPLLVGEVSSIVKVSQPESAPQSTLNDEAREFFANGNWDELVSVMEFSLDPSSLTNFTIMY